MIPAAFYGRRPQYPESRAALLALTRKDVLVTGGGLWACQEASGALQDASGNGWHLTEIGARERVVRNGRRGVRGTDGTVTFGATITWPSAVTSFAMVSVSSFLDAGTYSIMRMVTSAVGTTLVELYLPDDLVGGYVSDGIFSVLSRNVAIYPVKDTRAYWNGFQLDFAANKVRTLFCRAGQPFVKSEESIVGLVGIDTTANVYVGGNVAGGHSEWTCQFTGAQAEGATMLDGMAAAMGFV